MNFEAYESSSAQRRLYILRQLSGATTAFNISSGMTMEGKIDRKRFEQAFQQVIRRHEALRTGFDFWNGEVIQKIYEDVEFSISERDANGVNFDTLMHEFVQPFDLSKPPLMRAQIVRLGGDSYLLLFDIDHIISDGFSNGIIVNELINLYAGKSVSEVECQYVDFVMWQNDLLNSEAIKGQEAYWLDRFQGEIPVLRLPTDFPRPAKKQYGGDNLRTCADSELTGKIRELGAKTNATLFMVLLAAYQVLMAKYSGDEDIVVGTPVVGRQSKELFNTVGIFVNTLPMRNCPAAGKTFAVFLEEVKAGVYSGFKHQDYQLDLLLEKLQVKRDLSRNPLFDVVFLFQNVGAVESEMDGVRFTSCDFATKSVKYDLTLELHDRGDHLNFNWQYATDLFRETTVARMAEDFAGILRQVVEEPEKKISEITLEGAHSSGAVETLTLGKKRNVKELVAEGMELWQGEDEFVTVYERIELIAQRRRETVAIEYKEWRITYGMLENGAEAIAQFFKERGIWNQNVLFMLGRGPEFVLAMLGVMKAGGVFAPVDLKQPENRIAAIAREITPTWVVTTKKELERLEQIAELAQQRFNVLVMDDLLMDVKLMNDGFQEGVLRDGRSRDVVLKDGSVKDGRLHDSVLKDDVKDGSVKNGRLRDVVLKDGSVKNGRLHDSVLKDDSVKDGRLQDVMLKDSSVKDDRSQGRVLKDGNLKEGISEDSVLKNDVFAEMRESDCANYGEMRVNNLRGKNNVSGALFAHLHIFGLLEDRGLPFGRSPEMVSRRNENAYIYFTSGSTGVPKGILGQQRSLAHFIGWELREFGVTENCRVSQLISPSFDACLRDIFTPLCAGGTLCIPESDEFILDPVKMTEWIDKMQINLIHLTPAVFRRMLAVVEDGGRFAHLKYILLSGEPLKGMDVEKWFRLFKERIALFNLYGATETTMIKMFYKVREEDCNQANIVVGKPMPGAEVWVLNDKLEPCKAYEVGEVYIRTPFMTAGYYNQLELTKAVFLPNPFGADESDRIYKTGDLGCILPDGNLQLVGRADGQVKIRGVRVEVADIENWLLAYKGVTEAAVVAAEDDHGEMTLTGYLTTEDIAIGELRGYLRTNLPEYMIPTAFFRVDAMPLNANGKIDRRALVGMGMPLENDLTFQAAGTELERKLATIWAEVLERETVGVYDHFFDLGGHSLKAMQVVSRIRKELGMELSLADFFADPTIAGVLKRMVGMTPTTEWEIVKVPPQEAYELSYAQQRLWLIHKLEPESTAYHLFGRIELNEAVDLEVLRQTLLQLVSRHESLRTRFVEIEGVPMQVIDPVPDRNLLETYVCGEDRKTEVDCSVNLPVDRSESESDYFADQHAQVNPSRQWQENERMGASIGEKVTLLETVSTDFEVTSKQRNPWSICVLPIGVNSAYSEEAARFIDLSDLDDDAQMIEKERVFTETVFRPLNFVTGPLFRFRVVRLAEEKFELIYTMHHIISDGWSQRVLQRDFELIYEALKAGREPEIVPLPVQYKDFAAWQNQLIANPETTSKAQAFWMEELSGAWPVLNLPRDLAYEALRDRESSAWEMTIPVDLLSSLKKLGEAHHASLFMVMLAGFEIFLWRVTNQTDLLIGIPTAGREHEDLKGLIGFFINTNVLRTRIEPGEGFMDFLDRVQKHTLEMLQYQNYPLELVVDVLKIQYPPISVFFNMLNILELEHEMLQDFSPRHIERVRDVKFDLAFYLTEYANGLVIACHYLKQVFSPQTVESMLTKYIAVLRNMVADPEKSLKELAVGKEKRKLNRS